MRNSLEQKENASKKEKNPVQRFIYTRSVSFLGIISNLPWIPPPARSMPGQGSRGMTNSRGSVTPRLKRVQLKPKIQTRLVYLLLSLSFLVSTSLFAADAIPVGAQVCNVVIVEEGSLSYYSCDGSPSQPLDALLQTGGELYELTSGQLAKFITKGYRLIDCQLATFPKALNSCLLVRSK